MVDWWIGGLVKGVRQKGWMSELSNSSSDDGKPRLRSIKCIFGSFFFRNVFFKRIFQECIFQKHMFQGSGFSNVYFSKVDVE